MGSVLDFRRSAARARAARPSSAWGLVTELVERDESDSERRPVRGRKGVVHMGDLATVCVVQDVPAVGDIIRADVPGVVEKVRITHEGRVIVYARPLEADGDEPQPA